MSRMKPHRRYPAEFKQSAIALVIDQKYTNEAAGRRLSVPEATIV